MSQSLYNQFSLITGVPVVVRFTCFLFLQGFLPEVGGVEQCADQSLVILNHLCHHVLEMVRLCCCFAWAFSWQSDTFSGDVNVVKLRSKQDGFLVSGDLVKSLVISPIKTVKGE